MIIHAHFQKLDGHITGTDTSITDLQYQIFIAPSDHISSHPKLTQTDQIGVYCLNHRTV